MVDQTDTIKPSLWYRLFDSSVSVFNEQIGRKRLSDALHDGLHDTSTHTPSIPSVQGMTGGGSSKLDHHLQTSQYILGYVSKALLRVVVLSLAMYISLLIFSKTQLDRKITQINEGNNQLPESYVQRYWLLIALYLVFVVFTTVMYIILKYMMYGAMYFYIYIKAPKDADVASLVISAWNTFWNTYNGYNGEGSMSSYDNLVMIALYGLLVFFALYAFFAKSFITQLNYPNYTGLDQNSALDPENEYSVPCKLLAHQATFIVLFLLFVLSFLVIQITHEMPLSGWWQGVYSLGAVLWITIYAFMYCMFVKYELQQKSLQIIISLMILILFVVLSWWIT